MKTLKVYAIVLFFLALMLVAFGLMNVQQEIKPEILKAEYELPRSKYLRVFNQDIHYTDDGSGQTLILLHGVGESLHVWYDILGELTRHFRVITITLPGHGLSGPSPRDDYSIGAYTSMLENFMRKLSIDRASLVGFSLGGYVAWSFAATYPKKVAKLVLLASGGYPSSYRLPMFFIADIPYVKELLRFVTPSLFVRIMLNLSYMPQTDLVTDDLVKRYYDLNHLRGNRAALLNVYNTLNKADTAQLSNVSAPTLILWGSDDRVLPAHYAKAFESALPGSRLTIYKGVGHCLVDIVPKDILTDMRKFLAPRLFRN